MLFLQAAKSKKNLLLFSSYFLYCVNMLCIVDLSEGEKKSILRGAFAWQMTYLSKEASKEGPIAQGGIYGLPNAALNSKTPH